MRRPSSLPGLPGTRLNGRTVGATRTYGKNGPSVLDVAGLSNMKVSIVDGGGVITPLRLNSEYADYLTEEELKGLRRIIAKAESIAVKLSRGTLSTAELRRRRHPYGRGPLRGKRRGGLGRLPGARGGISNLAVVNRQSGDFAEAWYSGVRADKSGLTGFIGNASPVAPYLAFGTKRMKAHAPFTAALAQVLDELYREWRRVTRLAAVRSRAIEVSEMPALLSAQRVPMVRVPMTRQRSVGRG